MVFKVSRRGRTRRRGVILVTATTVVVVKCSPGIKREWTAKVSPSLSKTRERLVGKPADGTEAL
jgi:hypothetical protein